MMPTMIVIKTQEIKAGDKFRHEGRGWDAIADANSMIPLSLARELKQNEVAVRIRHFPDGGSDVRIFPFDNRIEVTRKTERVFVGEGQIARADRLVEEEMTRHDTKDGVREEAAKTEAEKLYDVGYKAGVKAVLETLLSSGEVDFNAGPGIRGALVGQLNEHFKSEGKI